MKNIYAAALALLTVLFFPIPLHAQKSVAEGRVVYEITYPDMELDSKMAAMLPTESVVYFKNNRSRTETTMGMGMSSASIIDSKSGKIITLMDMMGNKIAMIITEDDIKKKSGGEGRLEVKNLPGTKTIAGYECKKASLTTKDGASFDLYYTDKIQSPSQFNQQYTEIKGFPMEYHIEQTGLQMKMTAKAVHAEIVDDSKFVIPPDYQVKTMEELMNMMKTD